eukprot:scaffold45027_cov62-Phaeocystis_antarctica.AAC.1
MHRTYAKVRLPINNIVHGVGSLRPLAPSCAAGFSVSRKALLWPKIAALRNCLPLAPSCAAGSSASCPTGERNSAQPRPSSSFLRRRLLARGEALQCPRSQPEMRLRRRARRRAKLTAAASPPLHLRAPQASRFGTDAIALELNRAPAASSRASQTPHSTRCSWPLDARGTWDEARTPGAQWSVECCETSPTVRPEGLAERWRCAPQRGGMRTTSRPDDCNKLSPPYRGSVRSP